MTHTEFNTYCTYANTVKVLIMKFSEVLHVLSVKSMATSGFLLAHARASLPMINLIILRHQKLYEYVDMLDEC